MPAIAVTKLIGVYDANGSLGGKLVYSLQKLTGQRHCSLCDITHGGLRRRPEFDSACTDLGVPFSLLHRDERPPDVLAVTGDRTPMVLGCTSEGLIILLGAEQLDTCGSSPESLVHALHHAIAALGLRLAA